MALPRSLILAALCTACQAIPQGPPPTDLALAPLRGSADAHELAILVREAVPARFYQGSPAKLRRLWIELHALGRDAALDRLEGVLSAERSVGGRPGDAADRALARTVELLFEPRAGAPVLRDREASWERAGVDWSAYPLVLVDGLPYLLPDTDAAGTPRAIEASERSARAGPSDALVEVLPRGRGRGPDAERALRWARAHGRLRAPPPAPRQHPLDAVEQLLDGQAFRSALVAAGGAERARACRAGWWALALRTQALRAMPQSALAGIERDLGFPARYLSPRAAAWPQASAALREQAVSWSEPVGFVSSELTAIYSPR
ncbi:MAG: hypothetical protein ACYS26_16750 [Planctomycetota bacterium]|jgi:hypothetical protein